MMQIALAMRRKGMSGTFFISPSDDRSILKETSTYASSPIPAKQALREFFPLKTRTGYQNLSCFGILL